MLAIFYINNSPDNSINKSLTELFRVELTVTNQFDSSRPNLTLVKTVANDFNSANYCQLMLPDGAKFYFIESVTNKKGLLYDVSLRCDVLESYKLQILAADCSYKRELKVGDYDKLNLDESLTIKSMIFNSPKSLSPSAPSYIFTTIGVNLNG